MATVAGGGGKRGTSSAAGVDDEALDAKRRRQAEVTGAVKDLDDYGARDLLDTLGARWRLDDNGATFDDTVEAAFANFGMAYSGNLMDEITEAGSYGLRKLDDTIGDHEVQAIALYNRMRELDLFAEDGPDDAGQLHQRSVKIIEMVFYAKRVVLASVQAKLAVHQLHLGSSLAPLADDLDARLGSWALRFRWIDSESTSPMQKLLLHLLDTAMEKRYRKQAGWCYEPVFVEGKATHAWRPVCEIKTFVHSAIQKELTWEQWCNATSSMKNISSAVEYLSNCKDFQFPDLVKQRGVYSFRNGVYTCCDDTFRPAAAVPDTVVACKFFDTDLPDDLADPDVTWRDIPTPHMQGILEYQEFNADVCKWMYILLGRVLYELNDLDGWQVIPFVNGQASSGKCFCAGTPVLMYDGTSRAVETIGVGELVMGDDSTPRRVLELARGTDEMFTLVPKKKLYQPITVTKEHVLCLKYSNHGSMANWKYGKVVHYYDVDTRSFKCKKTSFRNQAEMDDFVAALPKDPTIEMTVGEFLELPTHTQKYMKSYRTAVDFAVTEEPLFDPWIIGAWLGDGCSAGPGFTNKDEELLARLSERLEGTGCTLTKNAAQYQYRINRDVVTTRGNPFTGVLKAYNLIENKHIPEALKLGSRETRMAVLAGLLDTDGHYDTRGYYEITQKNEILANDIVFVARSLGFAATIAAVKKWCMYKGERREGVYHRVNISGDGLEDIPLAIGYKKHPSNKKCRKNALRWGFTIEPAGVQQYFGFQTTGNQRFVLGDFTVTHNSTILLRVAKLFYEAVDVGVLSNNVERKFGISAFHDKMLFVAPEIKNDLQMEQAEFQSVVSGEDIQINVKFAKAFATQWKVPGLLAGNEVPAWVDNSGSIQRRIVLFDFAHTVTQGDMKLGEKLETEIPLLLIKCNKAYLEAAHAHGGKNIWTVLPEYFINTRATMAQNVNPVEAFLASEDVVLSDSAFCPVDDFKTALRAFETQNGYRNGRYTWEYFRGPLGNRGILKTKDRKEYRGKMMTREYLVGLDVVNVAVEQECEL